jgi:murein L,D-transpeptidase YcbB/YkuD
VHGVTKHQLFSCMNSLVAGSVIGLLLVANSAVAETEYSSAKAFLAGDQLSGLDEAITQYSVAHEQGGWQAIPDGSTLVAGSRHADVRLIRRRLRASGDYQAQMGADPLLFDIQLAEAVQRFQARNGLVADGEIDLLTRRTMSISVEERLDQLKQARIAWQGMPDKTNDRRVWVNIPEATVTALDGGKIRLSMRAIVGHPSRPTPTLTSKIRNVIVNPSWTAPKSIAVRDLLPRQQRDNSFLGRNNFRIYAGWAADAVEVSPEDVQWQQLGENNFPYVLRQDPGPGNSLGQFKFEFPNEYDVYLHDTPSQGLLGLSYRTLSSGCVRVEEPRLLADWLVGADQLKRFIQRAGKDTSTFALSQSVALNLVYLTAWVSPTDNTVQFRADIYQQLDSATNQSLALTQ